MQKALILSAILKRIGNFDLSTFEGRLVLQKTVYLFQSFGFYLGYTFSWYIHGPYCPELTRDAFQILPIYEHASEIVFGNTRNEKRFNQFLDFLGNRKNDGNWLEQLACTHFLKSLNPKAKKNEIIDSVLEHETHFSKNECEDAWNFLVDNNLLIQ